MKKSEREERALEKTVIKAERIAREIKRQEAKTEQKPGCSVPCPECGQVIQAPYSGFVSKEAADRYALDHCDCKKATSYRPVQCNTGIMPLDQLAYILCQPAPQNRWEPCRRPEPPHYGACRYCGQAQSVYACANDAEAEEYATRHCRCSEAIAYQDKRAAIARRASTLAEARENIDDLFGEGALDRGDDAVKDDVLDILCTAAEMVYDGKIAVHQMSLTLRIKSKISLNKKGNLEIERKDAKSSKAEVNQ